MKLTYNYDTPIEWSMYNNGENVREENTYTFLPFDEKCGHWGIISENQNYKEQAFIVECHPSELLKNILTDTWEELQTDH